MRNFLYVTLSKIFYHESSKKYTKRKKKDLLI